MRSTTSWGVATYGARLWAGAERSEQQQPSADGERACIIAGIIPARRLSGIQPQTVRDVAA